MRDWESFVRQRLSIPDLKPEREQRIVRELAAQLEDFYLEAVAGGMNDSQADAHVRRQVQDWHGLSAEIHNADRVHRTPAMDRLADRHAGSETAKKGRLSMFSDLYPDFVYGLRSMRNNPGFTLVAILTLALGIGANTAIFTLVDALLFRPLPFERPEEMVHVYQDSDDGRPSSTAYPAYLDIAAHSELFSGATAIMAGYRAGWMRESGELRQVSVAWVTSSYFPVLGVQPFLGRALDAAGDRAGGESTAVVSYRTWQREMGSDPNVLGRVLKMNGRAVTLIGVAPEGHGGTVSGNNFDFWLSLSSLGPLLGEYAGGTLERRADHWFDVLARLRPGVGAAQAQAGMDLLAARLEREFPEFDKGRGITVLASDDVRIHPELDGSLFPAGAVLMAVSGLVLLIACSNLANLLLARGVRRGREISIRLAVGASRGRIVRQVLVESVLLAVAGGVIGVVIAGWLVSLLTVYQPPMPVPVSLALGIDVRVLAFTLLLSLGTGILFGLFPALRTSRPDLVSGLKETEGAPLPPASSPARRRFSLRNALIVAQVTASLVLLLGAGLLIRSLARAGDVDLGFSARERLAVLQIDAGQAGFSAEQADQLFRQFAERARALPGVQSLAFATRLPVTRAGTSTLVIDEYTARTGRPTAEVDWSYVSPNYFETLGVPVVVGRVFTEDDRAGGEPMAVISEAMARRYWNTPDAVGLRYRHEGAADSWTRVVGVVGDVKVRAVGENPTPIFYRPLNQGMTTRLYAIARTSGDPAVLAGVLQAQVRQIDPDVPVYGAGTMDQYVAGSLSLSRTAAGMLGLFGVVALALAATGLYGVVAFAVSQRTSEVGIRMALGARTGQVVAMMIREVMVLVGVGLLLGMAVTVLLAQPALGSLLVGVRATDPLTLLGGALLLALVALLACWIPARRVAAVDPVQALRCQ